MLHLEFGFVVEPAPAQRPRFQPIFLCAGGGANYRSVKLGVLTGFYTKSVFTGKEPRLLLHAVIVTVDLVFAGTEVTTAAHRSPGKAPPRRHAGLFGIITLAILLTFQQQITPGIDINALTVHLRTNQSRVALAFQRDVVTRIHRRF